jgi:hypothetical protein
MPIRPFKGIDRAVDILTKLVSAKPFSKQQNFFPSELLNNDILINQVLENGDIDFDLWDIENLRPPPNDSDVAETPTWPIPDAPKPEVKAEPISQPAPAPALTHPAGIVVTPVATFPQQPQLQPVQTIIESPTIRNLLTRNSRVQDLIGGQVSVLENFILRY